MMELNISTPEGKEGAIQVSDFAFGKEFNEGLVHQVVVAYQAASRQGSKAQKNRSAVSGGGAKPWRQKGTGRARAGTVRSPIFRGGGVTFAAQPRSFKQKVNRKMYRAAMRCIFSELIREERLIVVEAASLAASKTRDLLCCLAQYDVTEALIVTSGVSPDLYLASRNLPNVSVVDVQSVDPVSLVAFERVFLTVDAVGKVEELLA